MGGHFLLSQIPGPHAKSLEICVFNKHPQVILMIVLEVLLVEKDMDWRLVS